VRVTAFLVLALTLAIARLPGQHETEIRNLQDDPGNRGIKGGFDAWARENYSRALDLALPDRCASSTDARWLACIRIVPGYPEEIEYSLSIEKRYDGTILAQIVRPKGTSIRTQLRDRRKEHPRAPVSELAKLIRVESRAGDQHRFPGLVQLAAKFEQIRFPLVPSDETMMDATQYRFQVRSSSGEHAELVLSGPGSDAPHQPQALIEWAESVRQLLAGAFP